MRNRGDYPKIACAGVVILGVDKPGDKVHSVLLVETRSHHWGFPKGKKEAKEGKRACALREVMEETSLEPQEYTIIVPAGRGKTPKGREAEAETPSGLVELSRKGNPAVEYYVGYLCREALDKSVSEGKREPLRCMDEHEGLNLEWHPLASARKLLCREKNRADILDAAVRTYHEELCS